MRIKKTELERRAFPENIATRTTPQSRTKLRRRRQKVLNLLGGADGGVGGGVVIEIIAS